MNTTKWQRMNNQQRQQTVECPCGYEIQNLQYLLSDECEYMEESLQHMYLTIDGILQSDGESAQQCWLLAQYMEGKAAAIMNMDVRAVTPDALWELGLSVRALVGKVGGRLSAVNTASETWPVSCEMWAPEIVGP